MEPYDTPSIKRRVGADMPGSQTAADISFQGLTPEVLRDIARNDSASRSWKKAAIKFLMDRNHRFQHHPDLRELREEIIEEQEAEREVQAVVESAIEAPININPETLPVTTQTVSSGMLRYLDEQQSSPESELPKFGFLPKIEGPDVTG